MTTITVSPDMCVAASDAASKLGITLPASQAGPIIKAALAAPQPADTSARTETAGRYTDEIDAARAGFDWLDAVRKKRCSGTPSHIERFGLLRNGIHVNGGLTVLWGRAGQMVASYAIVRDDANCSVLVTHDALVHAAAPASMASASTGQLTETVGAIFGEIRCALDETYDFASTSPGAQDNINFVCEKLDEVERLLAATAMAARNSMTEMVGEPSVEQLMQVLKEAPEWHDPSCAAGPHDADAKCNCWVSRKHTALSGAQAAQPTAGEALPDETSAPRAGLGKPVALLDAQDGLTVTALLSRALSALECKRCASYGRPGEIFRDGEWDECPDCHGDESALVKDLRSAINSNSSTQSAGQTRNSSTPVRCSQCGWLGDGTELGPEGECGGEGCPGTAVSEITTPANMIDAWQDSEGEMCRPQLADSGLIALHPASSEEAKRLDLQPGDSVWDLTDAGKAVLDAVRGEG
ncbi:hypothetical protein ABMY26_00435 (plasmid) [Azospirillum sp. HJ39]|uniref:hypothetical protein n=1 Tax=Azospirillum sp. HJ39 TaxID=3159496 RepID=UPI0035592CB2